MNDTPALGIAWCPGCEPQRDPSREILEVRRCDQHALADAGDADELVQPSGYLVGSAECEGISNRLWCNALHRGQT